MLLQVEVYKKYPLNLNSGNTVMSVLFCLVLSEIDFRARSVLHYSHTRTEHL